METFVKYIDEKVVQFQSEEQNLIASDRKDEANFIRIRMNICDVCKTIYNVWVKRLAGDELKEEYIRQLTRLAETWKISYDKAKEHNDIQKLVIEEAKLDVLKEIKEKFLELEGCE